MAKSKNKVPELLVTYAYIRSRLGYASKKGESIWKAVADALAKDGIFNTQNLNPKTFVAKNSKSIIETVAKEQLINKPQKRSKGVSRPSIENQPVVLDDCNLPWSVASFDIEKPLSPKKLILTQSYEEYQKESQKFLASYAWRKVRMEALKLWGGRCQCCGASPKDGKTILNVDHIKPRITHPELALEINNLQVLCGVCNHGKGNWDDTDWRS